MNGLRAKLDAPPADPELEAMRRTRDRFAAAPLRPVGAGWRERRAVVWSAWDRAVRRVEGALTEPGVAGEANGVGRIPPDAPVGRDTDEGRTDLASRSLDVPGSVSARVERQEGER